MHKRVKTLIITGIITVNTVSQTLEVLANELNEETVSNNTQNYNDIEQTDITGNESTEEENVHI